MKELSDHKPETTTPPKSPSKQPVTGQLTDQELNKVSGGTGGTWAHDDESPKETNTFET